jgi:hypothetical protein
VTSTAPTTTAGAADELSTVTGKLIERSDETHQPEAA